MLLCKHLTSMVTVTVVYNYRIIYKLPDGWKRFAHKRPVIRYTVYSGGKFIETKEYISIDIVLYLH